MRARRPLIATVLLVSLAACTDPPPEYPKLVPINSLDERFRPDLGADRGKTDAVQLAPGVYAERGSEELGDLDDYHSYVGLCVDVQRYDEDHPGGYGCW